MTRSIGKWKLPQPTDIKEENEWVQIPRIARTVPFGYKLNEEDPDLLDYFTRCDLEQYDKFLRVGISRSNIFGIAADFKDKTGQNQAFLSGNPEYEKEKMQIKGSNVYWGFTESMKWIINSLEKIHTGNVSDYVLWFVVIMAILFILEGVI